MLQKKRCIAMLLAGGQSDVMEALASELVRIESKDWRTALVPMYLKSVYYLDLYVKTVCGES